MIKLLPQKKLFSIVPLLSFLYTNQAKPPKELLQADTSNLISIESLEISIYNSSKKIKL
jgi:hypothetical protein